jgi:hypothetical protein
MGNVSNLYFIPVVHFLSVHTLQQNILNLLKKQTQSTFILKIKLNIAEHGVWVRTGFILSGQCPMADAYDHGNEHSGSTKGTKHHEEPKDYSYKLAKKDSAVICS